MRTCSSLLGLPMDGGRVLRSAVKGLTESAKRGICISGNIAFMPALGILGWGSPQQLRWGVAGSL